ncbi:hypothetical protein GH714_016985 [Hevea brasiliensis]|uniref:Intron-binding protein aquarius n=1 Tax=Hevea brasiliensis TaxID=3981 RepID=A0A6A6NCY9_HEVBR|nr:hypothetical protein GH714_016985 [Hevea brasiliensis]
MTKVYGTGAYDFKRHHVAEYPVEVQTQLGDKPVESKLGSTQLNSITLSEIQRDRLTKIAAAHWLKTGTESKEKNEFDPELVKQIYETELKVKGGTKPVPLQRVMILEVSQYLENYLWPNFDPETATFEHVMSMILMINEKFRENVAAWLCFYDRKDVFKGFLERVLRLKEGRELSIAEKTNYLVFMINAFQSLEDEIVSETVLKLGSLQSWYSLSYGRFQVLDFQVFPQKSSVSEDGLDSGFDEVDDAAVLYCERFMEFLIDLLSQLPTRRYLRPLVADVAVVAKCHLSALYRHDKGKLFAQLVDLLQFYERFEINDHVGTQLTDDEVLQSHYDRFQAFQLLVFKKIPKLKLVSDNDPWSKRVDFLIEVMVSFFEKQQSQKEAINALPLYPNEQIMWDESVVPSINYSGEGCLALPKLNLQFLTLHDYLLRNFNLFRLESTYEIREDIQEAVPHLLAYINNEAETAFRGWSRMAVPIKEFKITEVKQPNIGEVKPSSVTAEVTFSISTGKATVPQRLGLQYVRGCEIIEIRDEEGTLMNDFTGRIKRDEWKPPKGELRTVTVALDTAQYHMDVTDIAENGAEDVYRTFNVLMRRKPKENNFKAILESIRDLMNEYCIVPDWLHNIFLGYGNPSAAQWTNMPDLLETVDFKDTFLDADHLKESFPDYQVCFVNADSTENLNLRPPFRIRLPRTLKGNTHALPGNKKLTIDSMNDVDMEDAGGEKEKLIVEAYIPPDPGPYPQDQPKQNSVRFTPTQIGAILSGIQPGLTMVVGPPGTGKTDTAVQILNVLYHNCPSQRTLIITHSNQALNDLFEKIMQFLAACEDNKDKPTFVQDRFPFKEFFSNTPQPVLTADRANYLMTKQAKIVAMTCTHAALKRKDFLQLGFKYDNLLMEESAQILEIETFIPMLLQRQEDGYARLKRCILIGDHHQLPPVVKNMAFQKYSHMDQSLFTRFVRLGIPYIELNAQGRARPSIAKLYNWRGETAPSPWFYQNEGEAEYVVSVYIYMRLLGYPANKISILTTYNGQKLLIRDVINRRCVPYDFIGPPSKVTTVDKFQGQQNDFILLSLVRTRFVGHLRDVRRLVVAMSRARLGLYVFCRRSLFEQCYELQPTFQLLLQRPDHLALNLNEISSYIERPVEDIGQPYLVSGVEEMGHIVIDKMNQLYQARLMNYQFEQYHSSNMSAPANGAVDDTLHESKSEEAQEMDGIESGQNGDLPLQSQRNGERDAKISPNDENALIVYWLVNLSQTGERCSASSSLYTGGEDNWGADVFSHALATCLRLDLFDIIAQAGPAAHLTAAEITAQLPTQNPDAVPMIDRMLRLFACYSLLTCSLRTLDDHVIERRYGLSPTGQLFVKIKMEYPWLLPLLMINLGLRHGGNPFEKAHGVPMYKHISLNQESVKNFNKAMDNLSSYILSKVLDTYSGFRGLNSLVDVGGGSGVAINMIISKYPSISAINFDLPHVIKEAPPRPGGDMFSGIPSAEAIMMKDVLHNWSDEHCIKILKNCHDALPKGGKVIVVSHIMPEVMDPSIATKYVCQLDVMMFLFPGGKQRTEKEFKALGNTAGFSGFQFICYVAYNAVGVLEFYK